MAKIDTVLSFGDVTTNMTIDEYFKVPRQVKKHISKEGEIASHYTTHKAVYSGIYNNELLLLLGVYWPKAKHYVVVEYTSGMTYGPNFETLAELMGYDIIGELEARRKNRKSQSIDYTTIESMLHSQLDIVRSRHGGILNPIPAELKWLETQKEEINLEDMF